MNRKVIRLIKLFLPFAAVAIAVLSYYIFENNIKQKAVDHPYFIYLLIVFISLYSVFLLIGIFKNKVRNYLLYKSSLYAGIVLLATLINYITSKTTLLPTLYFPSLDRIFGLLFEQRSFLFSNLLSSIKLLLTGFAWGASIGFITGIALGYNKKVGYWLNPVTKVIGPIPTTAWIPLALSLFPTTHEANVFLLAFAVWFPVTLMTSSGIQTTDKVYFEVSSTLGAGTMFKIFRVAIPSAMPSIFLGIFYGTVSSFATLMAVEMNGNSSGIGWYINWQKQVMMYDGVYAGLIIIAILCSAILTLLFKVRDKILVWQKGVIRW